MFWLEVLIRRSSPKAGQSSCPIRSLKQGPMTCEPVKSIGLHRCRRRSVSCSCRRQLLVAAGAGDRGRAGHVAGAGQAMGRRRPGHGPGRAGISGGWRWRRLGATRAPHSRRATAVSCASRALHGRLSGSSPGRSPAARVTLTRAPLGRRAFSGVCPGGGGRRRPTPADVSAELLEAVFARALGGRVDRAAQHCSASADGAHAGPWL